MTGIGSDMSTRINKIQFLLTEFSLERGKIVLDFLVYLENNPLSDIYFINIVSCGLCLSFVNKVFHRH